MNNEKKSNKLLIGGIGLFAVFCICLFSILYIQFKNLMSNPVSFGHPASTIPSLYGIVPSPQGTIDVTSYFNTAYSYTLQDNYAGAIPYWNKVISSIPEDGTAYYYRAVCYFQLTIHEHVKEGYVSDIFQALDDINKAIAYGARVKQRGDSYYLRYQIFDGIAAITESRSDRENIIQLELQNLRTATSLGTSEKYTEQIVPLVYFSLNQCNDGLSEVEGIKENYGISAPPSASMLNIEAHGYLCLGQLDKSLEYVNQGLAIEVVPERVWLRSIILYLMGRNDDALNDLNGLIAAQPQFNGYRYYLRALIYYEKGAGDLANADLKTGSANTWGRGGLKAYVLGRMALDNGDKQGAIQYFQQALSSLDWYFRPMFPKIEKDLSDLGAKPLVEESQLPVDILFSTPMPTPIPISTPKIVLPTSAYGIPIPPNINRIDMGIGTGPIVFQGNPYPYPVYLFQSKKSPAIKSVQNMTLHLESYSGNESTQFEVFLWELKTGTWRMIRPGWGSATIVMPQRFVDSNGDVYLAIRLDAGISITFKNIWLSIQATSVDGLPIILDLGK